jgi:hypothetical protein
MSEMDIGGAWLSGAMSETDVSALRTADTSEKDSGQWTSASTSAAAASPVCTAPFR